MKINWIIFWEAAKEPLRLLVLALISWLITELVSQMPAEYAVPITFLLRFIDKVLHEYGKAKENDSLALGITRF